MNERRLRDMLESARSQGELGDLVEDLMKTAELKTPDLILAEAEVAGKDGQIRHLGGAIEAFYSKVADLKKKLEERDEKVKKLTAELEDARRTGQRQARELGDALERSINLEKTLQNRNVKIYAIGKFLESMTAKTPKTDLWRAVEKAKAAL